MLSAVTVTTVRGRLPGIILLISVIYESVLANTLFLDTVALRCENRPARRSASSETGLEMTGIPVQTGYGWKSLKVCLIDSNFRPLPRSGHHVHVSEILSFLHSTVLPGQNRAGREGKGRVERWSVSTPCLWMLWHQIRCVCQYLHDIKLHITLSNSSDNITQVCTASIWWQGEGGLSWCFHTRNDAVSSRNMDRNVSWRCYRQKHWTSHLQGARLVFVQGQLLFVSTPAQLLILYCLWSLLVYRGVDSLWKEE